MKRNVILFVFSVCMFAVNAQEKADNASIVTEQEKKMNFTVVSDGSFGDVVMPVVERTKKNISWWTGSVLAPVQNGKEIAFLYKKGTFGIGKFSTDSLSSKSSVAEGREIVGFSFSPDGKYLCFSEKQGERHVVCLSSLPNTVSYTEVTSVGDNYSPVFSPDGEKLYYCCISNNEEPTIKSYDIQHGVTTNVVEGMNPVPTPDGKTLVYCRQLGDGLYSIWKFDLQTGVKTCIARSFSGGSFTSPAVSPDGKWVAMTGNSSVEVGNWDIYNNYYDYSNSDMINLKNTDIYVCRIDGSGLRQLTNYPADDISPVWGSNGKYIYFVSQRGSDAINLVQRSDGKRIFFVSKRSLSSAKANVWRMDFKEE